MGHVIATGMAVMGGSLMAKYISERAVCKLIKNFLVHLPSTTFPFWLSSGFLSEWDSVRCLCHCHVLWRFLKRTFKIRLGRLKY